MLPELPCVRMNEARRKAGNGMLLGCAILLAILLFAELSNRPLYPESFDAPVEVTAVVIDRGVLHQGGGTVFRPVFAFRLNGKDWQVALPVASRYSPYAVGDEVTVVVDASDPHRISDPGHRKERRMTRMGGGILACSLLIGGLLLRKTA